MPAHKPTPLRIGLTGGIASGKSAVSARLQELGADIIDTDIVAREVTAPGEPALTEIAAGLGEEFIVDGELDRAALRAHVFADPEQRKRLEAILHPRIRARTLELASQASGPYQVFVVPLLVESRFDKLVDRILVVDCDPETQVRRLTARDGVDEAAARRMLAAQISRDKRLASADDVLSNDGEMDALMAAVERLHESYLQAAAH